MPWSPKQHRLFEWAGRNPAAAQAAGYNIPPPTALKMAGEGIKAPAARVANALTQRAVRMRY
jgi:hypothetical protein